MNHIMMIVSLALIFSCVHLSTGHLDLPEACVVHPDSKSGLTECDRSGEFWAMMIHNNREVFTCCKNERDAMIVSGPNSAVNRRGLYYGDPYKLCETINVDQETCRSREGRDCNYHTATYKSDYIGCFYCRARCESNYQCEDLGRVCSICRPEQPTMACTESIFAKSEALPFYHGHNLDGAGHTNYTASRSSATASSATSINSVTPAVADTDSKASGLIL